MSKSKSKRANQQAEKPAKNAGGKRRMLILITTLIILMMTGGALAQWAGVFSGRQKTTQKAGELAPTSFTTPSKEYVYAGGKLIATEEPQGSGPTCTYSLSPTSQNFTAGSNSGSFTITVTGNPCNWTAGTSDNWITNISPASGTVTGPVNFTVSANLASSPRTGSITAGGQTFTISQAGTGGGGGGTGIGLRGQYFTNISLTGKPAMTRIDGPIDFLWLQSPASNFPNSDNFSVRWTGKLEVPASGTYNFISRDFDDGFRLFINNQLIFENWDTINGSFGVSQTSPNVTLTGNTKYDIRIEYLELGGGAEIHMDWTGPGISQSPIPKSRLYPSPAPFGLDGDLKTDLAVWRLDTLNNTGSWLILNSSDGLNTTIGLGVTNDQLVPGDYDGDGTTDMAIWRPSTGVWHIRNSSTGTITQIGWGVSGDLPVPGDYDGDGKTDTAVWRLSGASGTWLIRNIATGAQTTTVWGTTGDVPATGDYDGDLKSDLAIWRPATGDWHIVNSSTGTSSAVGWGTNGDKVVAGDYDGDGKTDVAVYRLSAGLGTWFIRNSLTGTITQIAWGATGDKAVPGDYDGDGRTDTAIWRPSTGAWWIRNIATGTTSTPIWGVSGDVPAPSAYVRP
jgi:hypothetical protein